MSFDTTPGGYPTTELIQERVYGFLKIVTQSHLLGCDPLSEAKITNLLRMPRAIVHGALTRLTQEELLVETPHGFVPASGPLDHQERFVYLVNADLFNTPYAIYIDYLIGFSQILEAHGASLQVIHHFNGKTNPEDFLKKLVASGARGMAISGEFNAELRRLIRKQKIPTVMVGNTTVYQQDFPAICSDNFNGLTQLTRYLLQQGHERIFYYTMGIRNHHGHQQRLAGFEYVMQNAGFKTPRTFVYQDPYEPGMAARVAQALVKMTPRPTVMVCGSDRDAFELINELKQSGLNVPGDLGITGFYNTILNLIAQPALTSVEIQGKEIGKLAATTLFNELHHRQMPIRIVVPTELVIRHSVLGRLGAARPSVDATAKKTSRITYDADEALLKF